MTDSAGGSAWRPARVEGPRPQGGVAIGGATPPGASNPIPCEENQIRYAAIMRRSFSVSRSAGAVAIHGSNASIRSVTRD